MDFKKILKDAKRNWLVTAALSIVLGLILLLFPGITTRVVCFALGGLAAIYGVSCIVRYFQRENAYAELFRGDLMVGLFGIAIGLFMVLRVDTVVSLIPIIFGIAILAGGIAGIRRADDARRAGYGPWGVLLLLAILTMGLGVLLMINPFATIQIAVAVIGASLIYEGASDMIAICLVGKRIDEWKKTLKR